MRIGIGYDVHKLVENRKCILGGVEILNDKGLLGHSDADVLIHSICDALLGALAKGDIGKLFPDTDTGYKNISSMILLEKVFNIIKQDGYRVVNIDSIIIAEKPKVSNFTQAMRKNIAEVLHISIDDVSVKGTTQEKLGFSGRGEGIAAQAVVLLEK